MKIYLNNNLHFTFVALLVFCSLYSKAQNNAQTHPVKVATHRVITQEEIDNDTTGKYKIGVPSKKVLNTTAKKVEADKKTEVDKKADPVKIENEENDNRRVPNISEQNKKRSK